MKYTVILQNNTSKEFTVLNDLENVSKSHLYLKFDAVDLDLPEGEYTYVCFPNTRNDVTYEFKQDILETLVKTSDGNVKLRFLDPEIGLLRIGDVMESKNNYDQKNMTFYYEK